VRHRNLFRADVVKSRKLREAEAALESAADRDERRRKVKLDVFMKFNIHVDTAPVPESFRTVETIDAFKNKFFVSCHD
jgi:hypothetical protein